MVRRPRPRPSSSGKSQPPQAGTSPMGGLLGKPGKRSDRCTNYECGKRTPRRMRQSGSALSKLIRSVAAAGLWGSVLGKDQERNFPTKTQALTGTRTSGDRPLIGPGPGPGPCSVRPKSFFTPRPERIRFMIAEFIKITLY